MAGDLKYFFIMSIAMSLITYVFRMIPMTFFRKQIKSEYIKSLLYYLPYTVLSAMTFPAIFNSTGNVIAATVGTGVAIVATATHRPLIVVALLSCASVLIANYIIILVQ